MTEKLKTIQDLRCVMCDDCCDDCSRGTLDVVFFDKLTILIDEHLERYKNEMIKCMKETKETKEDHIHDYEPCFSCVEINGAIEALEELKGEKP